MRCNMSKTHDAKNKIIAKNTLSLYVRMVFVMIISLYSSRVILNLLGVVDFGIYSVVAGFVSLFGFMTATLSSSMQRFYNFEGTAQGTVGYQKVYSTGLIIHILSAVCLLILLETGGLWYVNHIMVIPDDRVFAANILYQSIVISTISVMLQVPYVGAVMAKERMGCYAAVSIVDSILKLAAVLSINFVKDYKLEFYSLLLCAESWVVFLMYYLYSKIQFKDLRFRWEYKFSCLKAILSFSWWNLWGTLAFMLRGQGVNMILNYFFGPIVNAARGIAFQVNGAVTSFCSSVGTSFRPQIVNSCAENDESRVMSLMYTESKVCFFLAALIVIPIMIENDGILAIWLGNAVPENTGIFTNLVLIDALICSLNAPCTQVVFAVGNIKLYQILSSAVNICLLPFCVVLLKLGFSPSSSFYATIFFSIINQVVCLVATSRLVKLSFSRYWKEVLKPSISVLILLPVIPYIVHSALPQSFMRIVAVLFADVIVAAAIGCFVVLDAKERDYVFSLIPKIHD